MDSYRIFISYSRSDFQMVREIRDRIEMDTGVQCWMDLKDIESGSDLYLKDITNGINNCEVFLFMLTERSQQSKYALQELNYASNKGKKIVIVNVDDSPMSDEFLLLYGLSDTICWTDELQREKLLRDLKRWSDVSEPEHHGLAHLKVMTDLDCAFYLDGENQMTLKAGKLVKMPLAEGAYVLEFVGVENAEDRVQKTIEISSKDIVLRVELAPKRAERLEKESARLRERDQHVTVKGVSFVMKAVHGGTFRMGTQKINPNGELYDSDGYDNETPVHSVTVDSFLLGETEVTQALWKAVMGDNPSCFRGDNLPVENVSYNVIVDEFIPRLNQLTGREFRLPTEAEWEYAARGGEKNGGHRFSGSDSIDSVAWYSDNSGNKTHAVNKKSPNELGLYDMSGNVWEWCNDRYVSEYYASSSPNNPTGSAEGSYRVLRGGCWNILARDCRVSNRSYGHPNRKSNSRGLRLALSIKQQ